jgi:hypothetical protein
MPIAGSSVLQQLRSSLAVARSNLDQLRQHSRQIETELTRLVSERGQAINQLAQHYLPNVSAQTIEKLYGSVQIDLADILQRKTDYRRQLEQKVASLGQFVDQSETEVGKIDERLKALASRRQELESLAAKKLADDPEFQKLTKLSLEVEQELQRHEQRVKDLEHEAHDKLPAYEQSGLFQYLYNRKWGTAAYSYKGMTKQWDRWVADLIGYPRAARSYEFLLRTPGLVAEEVAKRRADFDDLMSQIEARRDQVAVDTGLTAAITEEKTAEKQRAELAQKRAQSEQELSQAHQKLNELDSPNSDFYSEAVSRVRDYLARTQTAVLQARARRTPERIDDDLVARIAMLGDEIANLRPEQEMTSKTVQMTGDRADGLDRIIQRFVAGSFDAGRSLFDDRFDGRQWADHYLAGKIDEGTLWQQISSQQTWAPTMVTQAGGTMSDIANSPWTYVMLDAMTQVAGAAARGMAHDAIRRRHSDDWSSGNWGGFGGGSSDWGGSSSSGSDFGGGSSGGGSDSSSGGGGFYTSDSF